jgi:fibronectin type 3 domain-containing protein
MRISARLSGRSLRRLAAGAGLAALVTGSILTAADAPGLLASSTSKPSSPSGAPAGHYVSTEFASPASYTSTEFAAHSAGGTSGGNGSRPAPPTTAPIDEILAQPGHTEHSGPNGEKDVNVCSSITPPGYAHCNAHIRTDANGAVNPAVFSGSNGGPYDPKYLQSAYNATAATGGQGQTVAIAIAYDNPTLETDLANYRSNYGLPPCTTANGCFKKVDQNGGTSYPRADSGWGQESALDAEMVSALCPNCKIVVVEANSSYLNDLGAAVNTAVSKFGANVVSNSYGASEYSGETTDGATWYNHPGVAITVSSGDNGYGVEFPAASKYVTAVGGTNLVQSGNTGTRNATETVWSGAGSGCSALESKPSWQHDTGCSRRTVADVSAVADPNTPVYVYTKSGCGSGQSCWWLFGGTSVAAPIVGAIYALANNGSTPDTLSSYPYAAGGGLNDVTSGSNGNCSIAYLCKGAVGYDGPTGLGTPNGTPAFAPPAPAVQTPPTAPGAPAAAPADGRVTLSWSAPSSNGGSPITSYNVYRSTSSGTETLLAGAGNATTYIDNGLTNGTTYYYQVTAVNAVGESPRSAETPAAPHPVSAPSAPQGATASYASAKVTVSWSAPAGDGGSPVTSYNVYRGTSPGAESAYATVSGTSLADTAVTLGTTYYYVVRAVNSAGEGAPSNEASALAAAVPGQVTNLLARTSTTRGVTLTWSAPAANGSAIQGYKIYRSRSSGTETYYITVTCSVSSCSYTDTNTTRNAMYYYKIAAYNAIGTAPLSKQSNARAR